MFEQKPSALEAAKERLLLFIEASELFTNNDPMFKTEKGALALHLCLLGSADCSSQVHGLSDQEFGILCRILFDRISVTPPYAEILINAFVKAPDSHISKAVIVRGGNLFNEWFKGRVDTLMALPSFIKEFYDDASFPGSPGHLYVSFNH